MEDSGACNCVLLQSAVDDTVLANERGSHSFHSMKLPTYICTLKAVIGRYFAELMPLQMCSSDLASQLRMDQATVSAALLPRSFLDPPPTVSKLTPIWSPLTQASWQRRHAKPLDESNKKNSFRLSPWIELSIINLAPVCETSSKMQARRHVPSIAMMLTSKPFWNNTRSCFRRCSARLLLIK